MRISFTVSVDDWGNEELTDDEKEMLQHDLRSDLEGVAYRIKSRLNIDIGVRET